MCAWRGRRHICGRVTQITAEGLVVDSGYVSLLDPPFNQSLGGPRAARRSRGMRRWWRRNGRMRWRWVWCCW